jgi:hypothetical protein
MKQDSIVSSSPLRISVKHRGLHFAKHSLKIQFLVRASNNRNKIIDVAMMCSSNTRSLLLGVALMERDDDQKNDKNKK